MYLVSIIVTVFNDSELILECLTKCQKLNEKNVQIVVVDDCSTDDSFKRACEISKKSKNIIVHRNDKNMGVGAARNVGIDLALGSYVFFLDCDDTFKGNFFAEFEAVSGESPDLILTPTQRSVNRGDEESFPSLPLQIFKSGQQEFLETIVSKEYWPSECWGCFIRRELLSRSQIRFEPIRIAEDLVFMSLVYLNVQTVASVSEPVFIHTRKFNSLSKSFNSREANSWFTAFCRLASLAKNYHSASKEGVLLCNQINICLTYFFSSYLSVDASSRSQLLEENTIVTGLEYLQKIVGIEDRNETSVEKLIDIIFLKCANSVTKIVGSLGSGEIFLYCYDRLSLAVYSALKRSQIKISGIIDDRYELVSPSQDLGIGAISPQSFKERHLIEARVVVCHDRIDVLKSISKRLFTGESHNWSAARITTRDFTGILPMQTLFK